MGVWWLERLPRDHRVIQGDHILINLQLRLHARRMRVDFTMLCTEKREIEINVEAHLSTASVSSVVREQTSWILGGLSFRQVSRGVVPVGSDAQYLHS